MAKCSQPERPAASDVDPFSNEFLTDPFPFLEELRELGSVVYLARYGVWAVARHEQVVAVLRDHDTYSSASGAGLTNLKAKSSWRKPSILLETDPPVHTVNRRIVARVLSPRSLRSLQGTFARRAEELVARLAVRGTFDAVADLAEIFPTEVFPDAFGLRDDGKEMLQAYAAMVFNGMGPPNELFDQAMATGGDVIAWITEQCTRSSLRPDGLGAQIYAAVDAGEVTEEDAALLIRSFLSAGIDTTVNAIALGVLDFVRFPDQWKILRADRSLAGKAFDEVVRLECPVIGFFRTTTRSTSIGGTELPGDAKILAFFAGANRDPRRWESPDRFDIRRDASGHLGYGTGAHSCAGQTIARMEGEALFRALAAKVESWGLAGQPRPRLRNALRGLDTLPVEVQVA